MLQTDFPTFIWILTADEVAEWLRRWTANPMCSARVGSNPILVVIFLYILSCSDPRTETCLNYMQNAREIYPKTVKICQLIEREVIQRLFLK